MKPEVNVQVSTLKPHFTTDLYGLENHSIFRGFFILHVAYRANFQITKIEAQEKYFEQKIPVVLFLYRCESLDLHVRRSEQRQCICMTWINKIVLKQI